MNLLPDYLNCAFDEQGNSHGVEGSFIDVAGFDVLKFAKMLSSSNPTVIEWLITDIVYFGKQNEVFRKFARDHFSKIALYHHYKSMCRNNYLKYLKTKNSVTFKRYLYTYRGLVNAKWVVKKGTVPPIRFMDAMKEMEGIIPASIMKKLTSLIDIKKDGKEKEDIPNIGQLDEFIEKFLKDDREAPTEKSHATVHDLNAEVRKIILGR
ncbi:nucleotidyltransferase domain-containing protein [Candidatus Woesearchaeota archaeon]|nr:nucleotidyltransferase domain-containing protein [Candidatus Woesearchaeota archaeon]